MTLDRATIDARIRGELAQLIAWYRIHHPRRCFYCGLKIPLSSEEHTKDHVVPLAKGGGNSKRNKVAACRSCNGAKKDMSVEEFRAARYNGKPVEFFGELSYRHSGPRV